MAQVTAFEFHEAALHHLFTDTNGGIAQEMEVVGEAIAVATQENIGTEYSRGFQGTNPPPGPPYRRTGDLQASVRSTPAIVHGGVMEVNVIADATHRGFPYPIWLRIQGYEFIDVATLGL